MSSRIETLSKVFVALLMLPACGTADDGPATIGSGGLSADGGTTPNSSGGSSTGSGGALSNSGGTSTGSGGFPGTGGTDPEVGTGGSSSGGSDGEGSGGEVAGTGGMRVIAEVESTIPPQYRNPVSNAGKWTAKTYQAYYHGSGSAGTQLPKSNTAITKPVNVYTPPDYDETKEYPLIFALHGFWDNQDTWHDRPTPKPNVLIDNLIAAKVIEPVIAVFPFGSSTAKNDDQGGYTGFGSEMMGDLVPFIEANYKVKKGRDNRAIAGFSMGGMQTVNVFLCFYLKEFSWFAALSPVSQNSSAIASCLENADAETYPVNYLYIHTGANELATGSANASADGLTMKSPYITDENFTFLTTSGGHDYDNANIGLYNILRIAFPY